MRRSRNRNKNRNRRTVKKKTKIKSRRLRKIKGGNRTPPFVICESEGCIKYPSIFDNSQIEKEKRVTKMYKNRDIYQNELNKYILVSKYDPSHLLHPNIYSYGDTSITESLIGDKNTFTKIARGVSNTPNTQSIDTQYIDMEYVGKTITNYDSNVDCITIIRLYIQFIIQFLNLYNEEDDTYLIHADLHGGNVCIQNENICIQNENIKMIDLTNIVTINGNQMLHFVTNLINPSNSFEENISRQFSSICGTLIVLTFQCENINSNLMIEEIGNIKNKYQDINADITYNELKNDIIHILNRINENLVIMNAENRNPNFNSSPPIKRKPNNNKIFTPSSPSMNFAPSINFAPSMNLFSPSSP
jgi:hypothetical protein